MNLRTLKSLRGKIKRRIKKFKPKNEFYKRIQIRHRLFWNDPESEDVKYRKMYAQDSMENWQKPKLWQRQLSNKHNSREFAIKHGCRVPELYWQGRDYENIDFNLLPKNYVIRPITGWSAKGVFLMKGHFHLFENRNFSSEEIKVEMSKVLKHNPRQEFLIEEFVTNENGEYTIPNDYKFFMFNGEIGCIWVINRTNRGKGTSTFYNENWEMIDQVHPGYPQGTRQKAPACLSEMIQYAKELSKAYKIFVRIDFYATEKGAVFGEFTPTPYKGIGFSSFGSRLLIKNWDKYCPGMI